MGKSPSTCTTVQAAEAGKLPGENCDQGAKRKDAAAEEANRD